MLFCWHFPPFWLPPRARRICRSKSSYTVTPLPILLLNPHSLFGSLGTWLRCLIRRSLVGSAAGTGASIEHAQQILSEHCRDDRDRARLVAVIAPHSGDWLHALPISSCGLRLDDESIRIAVGLRRGTALCAPHICPCGSLVDSAGVHGLSCRISAGRSARHHQINDLVYRSLSRANFPAKREPPRLLKSDCKRPDGITLIPWREGKCLAWDATVGDTFAPTYLSATSVKASSAADHLASQKRSSTLISATIFTYVQSRSKRWAQSKMKGPSY